MRQIYEERPFTDTKPLARYPVWALLDPCLRQAEASDREQAAWLEGRKCHRSGDRVGAAAWGRLSKRYFEIAAA